jgi:glycosyl transferase family 4
VNRALSILITNIWLDHRAGSEVVVRDLAIGLLRRGHRSLVYSPTLGEIAAELDAKGIVVIDDLRKLAEPPDVIHAHHTIPCGEALIRFPQTPAVYVCNAFAFWMEAPVHFPQIATYVAVDEATRDRLVQAEGIDPARVRVVPNGVDLRRIPARPHPPGVQPRRAVAFGKASVVAPAIRQACEALGIEFQAIGLPVGRETAYPEQELVTFDLAFASARAALESLCCGCAVIACDGRGIAGLVTSDDFAAWRSRNFGLRTLGDPVTVERCIAEIKRYDAAEAVKVTKMARQDADLQPLLDTWEALYVEAIAYARRSPVDPNAHAYAVSRFLHENLPRRPGDTRWPWMAAREELTHRVEECEAQLAAATERILALEQAAQGACAQAAAAVARAAEATARAEQSDRAAVQIQSDLTNELSAAQARVAQAEGEHDELRSAYRAAMHDLDQLKRSRLLRLGRQVRRLLGRPLPY